VPIVWADGDGDGAVEAAVAVGAAVGDDAVEDLLQAERTTASAANTIRLFRKGITPVQ
jgi:hypothetical protein